MQMLCFLHARRMALSLALLGSLAVASGCDSSEPAPGKVSSEAEAQNKSMMEAMKKYHAPGGPGNTRPK